MMNHRCHFCCPGCCISFCSYIKPQCRGATILNRLSCISFYSYIKPQHKPVERIILQVVYRSIPTSNRNGKHALLSPSAVVYRSIPTSNRNLLCLVIHVEALYIVLFLHQTATLAQRGEYGEALYIVLFLHQTATLKSSLKHWRSCISFYSYIKPQLLLISTFLVNVVYRSIPTSNRNHVPAAQVERRVVYRSIPTSNRNLIL